MPYWDKARKKHRGKVTREGVTRTQLCITRKEALRWEADQKELPLDEFLNGTPTEYSLGDWCQHYLREAKEKYSAKTYQEKRLAFKMFFLSIDRKMNAGYLRPGLILTHFNTQAKVRSGYASNKDRKNLIAAWNWAEKYLPGWPKGDNPFALVEKQMQIENPRYVPPVEDFWKVYDSLPPGQNKVMIFAYLHTAARRGELFRLTWDEVDFIGHRLKLWTRKRKGGLESDWIPMTAELEKMLLWWEQNRTFPGAQNVFVCESEVPVQQELRGRPFVERQKWMGLLCKRAGVKLFGVHAIRHLSASILDDAGHPITIIQGILRHKSANTTAKYLHKLRGMRVALDEAFRRPEPPTHDSRIENKRADQAQSDRPKLRVIVGGLSDEKHTKKHAV